MRFLLILLLLAANAYAQPQPPPLSNPVALTQGGSELSNAVTANSTFGNINNLAVSTSVIQFQGSSPSLSGLVGNAKALQVLLHNTSATNFTLLHESASSSAANRFTLPDSASYIVPPATAVVVYYDTINLRWKLADQILKVGSPLTKSGSTVSIPAATTSVNGYLTSSDYTTYLDNWKQTGSDIYNTNTNNVQITLYPCVSLTTYSTCAAKSPQCTAGASGNCSIYDGNESGCNGEVQCSYNLGDNTCTGSFFQSGDCSGSYNADDGTSSKLQVKSTVQCSGSPSSCASLVGNDILCNAQLDCSYTASTCDSYSDETTCNDNGCSWSAAFCSGDNSQPNTCPNYDNDQTSCEGVGCTYTDNSCSTHDGDQATCEGLAPDCIWYAGDSTCRVACQGDNSAANSCPSYDGDSVTCNDSGCTYVDATCGGSNASCSGSARACNTFTSSGTCTTQVGCTYSTTPAGRFQGDLIATSDGFLKFEKTTAGAPSNADCNADDERGRLVIDTTNNRLYICNGLSRGWDYTALTN